MSERPKVQHSKCCVVSQPPWVQIPPLPPCVVAGHRSLGVPHFCWDTGHNVCLYFVLVLCRRVGKDLVMVWLVGSFGPAFSGVESFFVAEAIVVFGAVGLG